MFSSLVLFLSQFKNERTGHALPTHFIVLLPKRQESTKASQAQKKLCAVYGDEALKERQCRNWFERFRSGDFSLKNSQRSGHPVEVDETQTKAIIDSNRHSTTRDIGEKLNVSHTCIKDNN